MARAQTPVRTNSWRSSPPAGTPQPTNYTCWGLGEGTCLPHSCGPAQTVFNETEATSGYAPADDTEWNLRYTPLFGAGSRQRRAAITQSWEGSSAARVGAARELPASLATNGLARPLRRSWPRAWT
ncbi:hypothetical protein ACFP2F_18590 [Hymenobacter artigasi]|uniref:Uncharacterized protein n=1 Tax=Hymenobacter artigasi TaxID=2719616 RepID=A0ABX1HL18_9BACT|nr:hypothetical protein [Hymenobacter artigasi]NKI90942.1 hypothetical protein [Hymenobacter artigasi]